MSLVAIRCQACGGAVAASEQLVRCLFCGASALVSVGLGVGVLVGARW